MKKYILLLTSVIKNKLFYSFNLFRPLPFNYVFIISTKCNSRCLTCNVWKQRHDELKLSEWEKILLSLGRSPLWVTISGGEPFLQPHLVDLCRLIIKHNQPLLINIPTNAILTASIIKKVVQIAKLDPRTQIIINLSLDGIGKDHDRIRGVPGNFSKWLKTYQALKKLPLKNLSIGIHSVISKFNLQEAEELFDYAFAQKPDQYITEIAEERKELDTQGSGVTPNLVEYSQIIDRLKEKILRKKFQGVSRFTEAFRLEYYEIVKQWLKEKKQIIPCYAGVFSCQISSWGEVWPCCVRGDNLGNLRKHYYDFPKVWFGKKANKIRKEIKNKRCSCPVANSTYTNMLVNPRMLLKVLINLIRLT